MLGWRSGSAAPLQGDGHLFDPDTEHQITGAVVGYGGPLQGSCLEGFDFLGLHQIIMRIIHLDMDGVLVDFNKGFELRTGRTISSFETTKDFWKFAKDFHDLYRHPPIMWDALDLVNYVNGLSEVKVEILTAIPHSMPQAADHKAQWLEEHMPYGWKFKIGPYSKDKQFHARPGDILIDDKEKNITQWIEAGGLGILHTSAKDSINQLKKALNEDSNRY